MGFQKPNLQDAKRAIQQSLGEIDSPYNDGWTSSSCKKELWELKCWLDDAYAKLPTFQGEEEWLKERTFNLLKQR